MGTDSICIQEDGKAMNLPSVPQSEGCFGPAPRLELPDVERMPGFGDLSCVHMPNTGLFAVGLVAE